MSNRNSRRGRPRLSRETVQERLREFGWEIPENIKYRGANEVHTVRCTCCGYLTEKILHNVVYRQERCPNSEHHNPSFGGTLPVNSAIAGAIKLDAVKLGTKDLEKFIVSTVEQQLEPIKEMLQDQQEIILSTAINREDLIDKFNKLYAGTVARKGYLKYNRQMTTEEWYYNSDLVARELIHKLDPNSTTKLAFNYDYNRRKNPQLKPEKILLMIMNKKQLFVSLEKIQLIKMLL